MGRENQTITDMLELFEALYVDRTPGQDTCRAVLHWDRAHGDEHYYVRRHFYNGKGHNDTLVSTEIAEEAKRECYVEGLLYSGYVAKDEFKLSRRGIDEYFRRH